MKIKLQKEAKITDSNLSACRITLGESESNKLERLREGAIKKLKNCGLMGDNFDFYWQDNDGDLTIIVDNDDLSVALTEQNGPLYVLFACLHSKNSIEGKSS